MLSSSGSSSTSDVLRHNLDKTQLQDINQRFSNYIRNVKLMRNQLKQTDELSAITRLENEVSAIRSAYEQEIQNLQQKLEIASKHGGSTHSDTLMAKGYQNRLWELNQELVKKDDEIAALQLIIAEKEADIQGLKTAVVSPSMQLDLAKQELGEVQRNILLAQQRYEEEFSKRLDLEDQVLELNNHIKELKEHKMKESQDLRKRVEQSETLVLQMEDQVRSISRGGPTLMATVRKIQEASEVEVKRLQNETETLYTQSLLELQMTVDNDQMLLGQEREDKQRLEQRAEELTTEVTLLEKRLHSEDVNNKTIIEKLQEENMKGLHHIRALEARLQQLQDLLLAKMKELSTYQDKNVSLGTELDTLKSLLEEEEQQMSSALLQLPGSCTSSHSLADSLESSMYDLPRDYTLSLGSPETFSPINMTESSKLDISAKPPGVSWKTERANNDNKRSEEDRRKRPTSAPAFHLHKSPLVQSQESSYPKESNESPPSTQGPAVASATRDLEISEIHPNGHYVRLINSSRTVEEDLGGFVLQQNMHGHPVSLYRFPPKVRVLPKETVTVWASDSKATHKPPTDFLWKEQKMFVTKPQCTTILCTPNGQAIAWYTPVSSNNNKAIERYEDTSHRDPPHEQREPTTEERECDPVSVSANQTWAEPTWHPRNEQMPMLLRREKLIPAVLPPTSSPWTQSPASPTHPDYSLKRCLAMGNDGSSSCRQSRSQTGRPDPTPGVLWAGSRSPSGDRWSKCSRGPTRSAAARKGTLKLLLPGTFFPLSEQHQAGLQILQSVQNLHFQPPMPHPPPLSSW
ncbi:lamin tail domain-containing protein 1 [Discoglossus pictus]